MQHHTRLSLGGHWDYRVVTNIRKTARVNNTCYSITSQRIFSASWPDIVYQTRVRHIHGEKSRSRFMI